MKQKRIDGGLLHGPRRIWVREFHWQPTMSIKGPDVARYADMFTALGAEPRLRIIRLLLSAHPDGMVVGDIQRELAITASNLSHPVSYTHLRAHETRHDLVCRLLL